MNKDQTEQAKRIVDTVFKDIFQINNPFSLEEVKQKFAFDIPLPKKTNCALSGDDTWSILVNDKIASQNSIAGQFKKDEWLKKKKPINSIDDLFKYWQEINYTTGDKNINSKDVFASDGIYNSASVFNSHSIFKSKNIVFCYDVVDCNYSVACRNNESSTFGIRMRESINCSSGFEISWSSKVSKSMYLHDCIDLYECLFCSHIRSKRYCIANMQFEKEEYFCVKKMVTDWILNH